MEVLAGWLRINKVPLVFYIIFRKEKSRCWGIPNTGRRPETLPKQFSHRFPKLHQALRAIGEELSGRYFHTDYSVPTGTLDLPAELGQWQDACSRKQGSSFVSECRLQSWRWISRTYVLSVPHSCMRRSPSFVGFFGRAPTPTTPCAYSSTCWVSNTTGRLRAMTAWANSG